MKNGSTKNNDMLLSCQKATELIEKKQISGLSRLERWKLAMHLRLCRYCKNYEEQSRQIDAFMESAKAGGENLKMEWKERLVSDLLNKHEEQ